VQVTAALVLLALTAVAAADDAARGQAYLAPFKRDLQAALRSGLASGPAAAINACRLEAPQIAERYSQEGVRIGRASHRLRNPDNVTPAWVTPTLEAWLESSTPHEPVVVELGEDRVGYVEAIVTKPLCLTCHGETLAPEISAELESHYPEDQATGFGEGDLRGVFWVEFPR
jgi:hypothetical protein